MGKLIDVLFNNAHTTSEPNRNGDLSNDSIAGAAYQSKVAAQIEQFADQPIHDLPEIFHVYSDEFIRKGMESVFGTPSINEFYIGAVGEASKKFSRSARILSV